MREKGKVEIKEIRCLEKMSGEVKIEKLLSMLKKRYDFISKLLSHRLDIVNLISINKVSKKTKKFTIIGRVIEKTKESIKVEDRTGILEILCNENVMEGEICGFYCEREGENIVCRKVYYPDIPLRREIKTANIKLVLAPTEGSYEGDTFIFYKEGKDIFRGNVLSFDIRKTPVVWIMFSNGMRILFLSSEVVKEEFEKMNGEMKEFIKRILKRRLITVDEKKLIEIRDDIFLIEEIPDLFIFFSRTKELEYFNYKGTTIINLPFGLSIGIDLKRREIIKM